MALSGRLPAVLREEPQFRLFFLGQALSVLGDRIAYIAIPFAVLAAGGGVTTVGLVVGAQMLPFVLLSLAAGVWADRLERRAIMVASDAVRLVCQVLAGTLLVAGVAEPWHLGAIAFVYGTADAFFAPAMTGLMPEVVPPFHLQQANALRALTMSTGMVIGPAIGGVLVATAGAGYALIADAATFVVSIACLMRLAPSVVERAAEPEQDFLSGLRGGWREVRSRSWVVVFLAGLGVYHVIVLPAIFVLGPVLADRSLGGAGAWAVIASAFGAGSVVGNLALLRWKPARPLRASAACLIVASCQAAIVGSGLPLWAIAALECVTGAAVTGYFTLWETMLQVHIPERAISRVSSYDFMLSAGLIPLGSVIAGPVSEAFGLRNTMFAMTAIGILAAFACLSVPAVRTLGRTAAPPAPA